MIDREFAKKQVLQFTTLAFPPSEKEGMALLIDTLAKHSVDQQHCLATMEELIRNPPRDKDTGIARWPDAALIIAAAKGTRPDLPPSAVCRLCEGSGLVYAPFMRFDKFAGREIQIDASALCSCRTAAPVDHKMAAAGGGN